MAKQNQRKEVRQEARQAAQAGTFNQSNVQAMRQAGVQPQAIQNIREVARQAPAAASAAQGVNLGYGVTNTGRPGGYSMPGGTDPRTGQPIAASTASNIYSIGKVPFNLSGLTNIAGNPINQSDFEYQVVGDGKNWNDPALAAELNKSFSNPMTINGLLDRAWAMSSANPNRDANMAAFMDSGHVESLQTGRAPGIINYGVGLNTPWSQQYAAMYGAGGSGNAGGAGTGGTGGSAMSGGGGTGGGGNASASTTGQSLRSMGAGGLSKSEISGMMDRGKSGGDIIQRLDKINQSLKSKGQTGISLNSGAANMLIKQAGPSYGGMYGLTQKPTFGTGSIGKALEGMRGTRATGGYQNPQSGYGEVTAGTAPKRMMGGTAIRPGGRETVRGFGKQFTPRTAAPIDTTPASASTTNTGGGGGMDMGSMGTDTTPMTPEQMKEASTVGSGFGGFGVDVASWATGFKAKRSSRKTAGPRAQGLGSQRVSPTYNTLGL
jgi:hypothetical protein